MKKITFIVFALIAGTAIGQNSATQTAAATINAEIVSPITITNLNGLDFGRLIGNSAGGIVTVAATETGSRTSTNDDVLALTGNTPTAAKFNITAAEEYTYSISLTSSNELIATDADPMAITFTTNLDETGNNGIGSTAIALYVGGALTVNGGQAEGDYTGEVSVTVTYE
mgnify:FL=1